MFAIIHDRELVRNKSPGTRDALLAVQHLELVLAEFVEVDQAERVPLEQRFDYRLLSPFFGIDVITLVLGLNGELSAQPKQALSLQVAVHKTVADVGDGDVGS